MKNKKWAYKVEIIYTYYIKKQIFSSGRYFKYHSFYLHLLLVPNIT